MSELPTIAFLGAGQMAEALIRGLVRAEVNPARLFASDIRPERLDYLSGELGIQRCETNRDALKSDVVGQRCAGCDYITFNGLPTLERKARLAGAWGAGVMVWEIDQDLPGNRAIRTVRRALDEGRKYAR